MIAHFFAAPKKGNFAIFLRLFYEAIRPMLDSMPDIDFEVVCVDDGSRDDTLAKLILVSAQDERFRVIELSRNFGKEAALTAGIDASTGDAVIPTSQVIDLIVSSAVAAGIK